MNVTEYRQEVLREVAKQRPPEGETWPALLLVHCSDDSRMAVQLPPDAIGTPAGSQLIGGACKNIIAKNGGQQFAVVQPADAISAQDGSSVEIIYVLVAVVGAPECEAWAAPVYRPANRPPRLGDWSQITDLDGLGVAALRSVIAAAR